MQIVKSHRLHVVEGRSQQTKCFRKLNASHFINLTHYLGGKLYIILLQNIVFNYLDVTLLRKYGQVGKAGA